MLTLALLALLGLGLGLPLAMAAANFCPVVGADYEADGSMIKEYFECPGPDDPPDHAICCGQACCPVRHIDSVLQVDIQVAMVLSISIILASLATAATLVVCCFRRGCPLYDTCSGGYTRTPAGDLPGEYEGSDQDLLTPRLSSKRFYTTATDRGLKADKAEHV